MKKIRYFASCLAVLLILLAFACVPAGAASEDSGTELVVEPGYDYTRFKDDGITLNVYNWGEYISTGVDGEGMDVNAEFEKLTGIKVNYSTYETNEALYSKLKSGGAEYDVIIPSDYMIGKMINEGMLAPLNFDNIPNYSMIGDAYKNMDYDPDNLYSVPYTWGYVGIIYNSAMVDDEVDSWDILWDEKYAGNILMIDNSRDAFAVALRRLDLPINPTSTEQIDQAAAELAKQRPLVQSYVMDQVFDKMEGEEAALAVYYAGDALIMQEVNPNIDFAVPKEGTNYFVDAICIPANSQQQEAAEMYINFLCETQVAVENCLFICYSTPQIEAEAALPAELRESPIMYPSQEVLDNTWTFNVLPDELNEHMDKAWSDMRSLDEGGNNWILPVILIVAIVVIIVLFIYARKKKNKNDY